MWREIVGDGRADAQAPVDKIVVFNALPVAQLKITGPARAHTRSRRSARRSSGSPTPASRST
jgi:hypothetical protein